MSSFEAQRIWFHHSSPAGGVMEASSAGGTPAEAVYWLDGTDENRAASFLQERGLTHEDYYTFTERQPGGNGKSGKGRLWLVRNSEEAAVIYIAQRFGAALDVQRRIIFTQSERIGSHIIGNDDSVEGRNHIKRVMDVINADTRRKKERPVTWIDVVYDPRAARELIGRREQQWGIPLGRVNGEGRHGTPIVHGENAWLPVADEKLQVQLARGNRINQQLERLVADFTPALPAPGYEDGSTPYSFVEYSNFRTLDFDDRLREFVDIGNELRAGDIGTGSVVRILDDGDNEFFIKILSYDWEKSRAQIVGIVNTSPNDAVFGKNRFFVGAIDLALKPGKKNGSALIAKVGLPLTFPEFAAADTTSSLKQSRYLSAEGYEDEVRKMLEDLVEQHQDEWEDHVPEKHVPFIPILQPWDSSFPIKSIDVTI